MSMLACEGGRPVREEFLVFGKPMIGEEEIREVVDTLRSGWIGFGPKSLRFEEEFAAYVRAEHVVSMNSATAALHLALLASGVGPGDEVVTTSLTFCATANVVVHCGARPVFVDVDEATQNICPERLAAAITPRTKAILVVHMTGWPCDMDAISDVAERHGLPVIEDAAHATESWYRARKVGSISRFTAFSFYATKNMTTGEGGALAINDRASWDRVRALRLHGLDKDAWKRYAPGGFLPYEVIEPGFKYNMTDLQASLGLHQLARLEDNLRIRRSIWQSYDDAFDGTAEVMVPQPRDTAHTRHARHLYTLRLVPEALSCDRNQFVSALAAENIGSGIHFIPVHLHQWYRQQFGHRRGDFPVAEAIGDSTVSLPLSPAMTMADVRDVIEAVHKLVERYRTSPVYSPGWSSEDDTLEEAA